MRRWFAGFAFVVGLALIVGAGDVASQDKKDKDKKEGKKDKSDGIVTNWGKPKDYETGKETAFWVWYDDGVWHFRTTGGDKKTHRFNGTIEVIGGNLVDLKGKKGEYGGKNVDQYVFSQTAIKFDFKTDKGEDGLNFAVDANAKGLKFTIAIDGEARPKNIRLGKASDHPAEAVFTTPAHPADTGKKK